jgi:propanol-preferring alcohol dehydrogenase
MIASNANYVGLYGFGAAAHILIQIALHQGKAIYAFTRDGDTEAQEFATRLGAVWAGGSGVSPPLKLDGAIIFAAVGDLIPKAQKDIDKDCTIFCGRIHMSDIPSFPYELLSEERTVRSVPWLILPEKTEKTFLNLLPKFR